MARRTVLFLGAGASKPLGFPMTDGILTAIWSGLHDGSWRGWPGLRKRRDARKARNDLVQLIQALLPGLTPESAAGASIVDVISLLDQLIIEGRAPTPAIGDEQLRRGRALLDLGINAVLRGRRNAETRDHLVDWILREAAGRGDCRLSIVSTNYDTVIEQPLFDQLVEVGATVGRAVDFGISWRDAFHDIVHMRPRWARLGLFKLHGSLNWLRCETCGHVTINVRQRIAPVGFWTRLGDYNECYCGGRLRTVVVTPSVVRDIRDANLLSIWNAAMEDLRRAHQWIFVGYSLPSEDIAIRSLLLRAYHARAHRRLRIRVVQWEPETDDGERAIEYKRYRAFFPKKQLEEADYCRSGLESFVEELPLPRRRISASALRAAFPRIRRDFERPG